MDAQALWSVEKLETEFLGAPSMPWVSRRVLNQRQMILELGFHPDYLQHLEFEAGPNELGEMVRIQRLRHLTVVK